MGNNYSRNDLLNTGATFADAALGLVEYRPGSVVPSMLETLPVELWELIFAFCENKTLAVAVPRVCKFTRDLAHPNCGIWREKCKTKGITSIDKNASMTWKRRFFSMFFRMFPLLDFTIGISTYQQLTSHPKSTAGNSGQSRYVTIEKHNFWVNDAQIFTHMYIARGIYPIPPEWEAFGITWDRSWIAYKELFKQWTGNFEVVTAPHYREFQNKPCFSARLTTVACDSDDVCYMVDLNFNYHEGKEDSPGTLYSISISSHNYIAAKNYKAVFQAQKMIDKPSELDLNKIAK